MDKSEEKRIMVHKKLRYHEFVPDGRESSDFLICACCGVRVIGVAVDDEFDTIGRTTPNLTLENARRFWWTRERERSWRVCNNNDRWTKEMEHAWCACNYESGAKFPFPSQNINTHCHGTLEDQHLAAVIAQDGIGTLEPPEDKSIKTLVVRGFNSRMLEQSIRDKFAAYGVIKSIRFFSKKGRALVTYTTREEAEKATQELSKWLLINGQRLKLAWGRPQDHDPDQDSLNRPSAVISAQEVGGSSTSENSKASSSNIPIICEYCRLTGAAVDDSDSIIWRQRLSRYHDYCTRGAKSPFCTLKPPKDKSIKTLVIRGFDSGILEQNIRDKFVAYGEIESIRFFAKKGCALVTYTNREGVEKATQGLSKWLLINGLRLKLAWGRPQDHEPDQDSLNRPSAMDLGTVISAQEVGGSSTSEIIEASSSSYQRPPHLPPPSQDEYRTNPKRSKI